MATVASVDTIRRIRRLIRDDTAPYTYDDIVICDQVQFALEKLSYDFGEDPGYLVDTDVPTNRKFLLIKLATILMAYIRAGDEVDNDDSDISSITVPDLTVVEGAGDVADKWLSLAERLQREYDDEVGKNADGTSPGATANMPPIQVGTMFTTALRTNSRISYGLDAGIDAPTGLAAVVSGATVTLTWTPLLVPHFSRYELYQALQPDSLADPDVTQRVEIINDPHGKFIGGRVQTKAVRSGLSTGIYEFRLAAVSDNELYTFGPVVEAEVV